MLWPSQQRALEGRHHATWNPDGDAPIHAPVLVRGPRPRVGAGPGGRRRPGGLRRTERLAGHREASGPAGHAPRGSAGAALERHPAAARRDRLPRPAYPVPVAAPLRVRVRLRRLLILRPATVVAGWVVVPPSLPALLVLVEGLV